jgi:hypothetical protein
MKARWMAGKRIEGRGVSAMRFMIIVKASKDSEAGVMPSEKLLAEMGRFNEGAGERRDLARWGRPSCELKRSTSKVFGKHAHGH